MLWSWYRTCRDLRHTLELYEAERSAYVDATVYLLNSDVTAGEQLTRDCLTAYTVKLPQSAAFAGVSDCAGLLGSYAKTALEKGTVLSPDLFYEDASLSERSRLLEVSDIQLPEALRENDLIDVRISFPNGEDYVVLEQQKVLSLLCDSETDSDGSLAASSAYGISFRLSEEELLRLSSARVDQTLYDGTYLYAVIYDADFAETSETTYPVNPDVFGLMQWDPNVVSLFLVDKEQEKRSALEEHLQQFTQKETESFAGTDTAETDSSDTYAVEADLSAVLPTEENNIP